MFVNFGHIEMDGQEIVTSKEVGGETPPHPMQYPKWGMFQVQKEMFVFAFPTVQILMKRFAQSVIQGM